MIKFDLRTGILFFAQKIAEKSQIIPPSNLMLHGREPQGNDCPSLQYLQYCIDTVVLKTPFPLHCFNERTPREDDASCSLQSEIVHVASLIE